MMSQADLNRAVLALSIMPSKYPFKKITDPAHARMLTRTAKEQLAEALRDAGRPFEDSVPDADDMSMRRAGVLT